MAQNQHPEPEVLGGIQPERGQVFEQGYGGDYDETILGLTNTTFGVAACGWEEDAEGNKRAVIYEIDSIGVLLNKYTFNTTGHQVANSIFPLDDGGYIVAGRSSVLYTEIDSINIGDKAWVFRIDNSGQIAWEAHYQNIDEAEVGMSLLDKGNGYFWLLTNTINDQGYNQVRVRKIDSVGNIQTTKTHGSSSEDLFAYELIENDAGDMVLLANDFAGIDEPKIFELDDIGDELSNHSFPQAHDARAYGIAQYPNGDYVLAGEIDNGTDKGGLVIQLDDGFSETHTYTRDLTNHEYFRDIVVDESGAIAVGATNTQGEGGYDGFIVHLDTLCDSIMVETLGRDDDDKLMVAVPNGSSPLGGIISAGQSLGIGGNGYLVKSIKYGEIPCPLPRFLFVDGFVKGTISSINDAQTILGDTAKENTLLQYADDNHIKHLCLYGLNYLFEPGNANATRGGVSYDTLLNKFLTKAARKSISCALLSVADTGVGVFHSAGLFNLSVDVIHNNYRRAGKIAYFQLEHEFWNTQKLRSRSGLKAGEMGVDLMDIERVAHFEACYNDHISALDTLNILMYRDANCKAVYDYVDKLYFNWSGSATNTYSRSNDSARNEKAKAIEKRTNALFLSHYKSYRNSHKGAKFLYSNVSSHQVNLFRERWSYFGQNTRKTYLFPLFSAEWFIDSTDYCGSKKDTNDFLGQFFRDTSLSYNHQNFVEDTFISQLGMINGDTNFPYFSNVVLSGFGWFKYTCLDMYTFTNTDLNECPIFPALLIAQPVEDKDEMLGYSQEVSSNEVSIFPNPTTASFSVEHLPDKSVIEVYSSSGVKVLTRTSSSTTEEIPFEDHENGMYFIRIKSDLLNKTFKIIKQ